MIGKIYSSVTPFYDSATGTNSYKRRPVLIIAGPRNHDYTVLTVSTIPHKENMDPDYDVKVKPEDYPKLNLKKVSYIRTHKQTSVHQASLVREIGDLRTEYDELYLAVLEKLEKFNRTVLDGAL